MTGYVEDLSTNFYNTGKFPAEHCGNNAYLNSMGQSSLNAWRKMFDPTLLLLVSFICMLESRAFPQLWLDKSKDKAHCSTSLGYH